MVVAGIIDPTKVVRAAPQDAASVAYLLITTEAMIAENQRTQPRQCQAAAWAAWISDLEAKVLEEWTLGGNLRGFLFSHLTL